jgi:hypothetical protein
MSQVVAGVIDSIYDKEINTKFGTKPVYHAMINGQDINLGFKNPYVVGESVTLNVEHKYGGFQLIQGGAPPSTSNVPGSAASNGSASTPPPVQMASKPAEFPVPNNTKGITIARQNSGGHAARIVAAMIDAEMINNKADVLSTFIDLAYEITDFATGQREQKQAEAMQAYEEDE